MHDWIATQLAAGLPAFTGSKLSGTLAVKPEVVNELIARWLAGDTARSDAPRVDLGIVRRAIKTATVRAENGKLLIDVEISL